MTALGQQVVVTLLVVGAAAFVFWRLAPDALLLRVLAHLEKVPGLRSWTARRRAKLASGGCSGCAANKDIHPKR